MVTAITLVLSVLLDQLVGQPESRHPLNGFRKLARWFEEWTYPENPVKGSFLEARFRGLIGFILLVLPPCAIVSILSNIPYVGTAVSVLAVYLALSTKTFSLQARQIAEHLSRSDLDAAQQSMERLAHGEAKDMDDQDILKETVELVFKNGNDSIFGVIFWFVVLGAPGAVLYKLTHMLATLWSPKHSRYEQFGWAIAKLDTLFNWCPARLTSLTYSLLGNFKTAMHCWLTQRQRWSNRNTGSVVAAGAGSLGIMLGGPIHFRGKVVERPHIGIGKQADIEDIHKALEMVQTGLLIWVVCASISAILIL